MGVNKAVFLQEIGGGYNAGLLCRLRMQQSDTVHRQELVGSHLIC